MISAILFFLDDFTSGIGHNKLDFGSRHVQGQPRGPIVSCGEDSNSFFVRKKVIHIPVNPYELAFQERSLRASHPNHERGSKFNYIRLLA